MKKLNYLKRFNENVEEFDEFEEFKFDENDNEIEGQNCVDFKIKELKKGDKIFKKCVDDETWEHNWAKNPHNIESYNTAVYSSPIKYEVIEVKNGVIKLK